ncbi:MAG: shikimate dehydrogenase [Acidobacteria bacterium]|nr:MAG: shikimate dehydrogenase [Acidobacteriota bacterium]REK02194.1 MAG: shikimate dehydrogenase [Acidobacteriota bacterium]REK14003.1 MAG: shikimate dehydrogenase [Acidobacteriota bacterium]REK41998.1 MAG: shikimate dehydrogenase [Acidobacteriota bacterium]
MGRICISVSAETSSDFVVKTRVAFSKASAVELRFDSLDSKELDDVLEQLSYERAAYDGVVIGTFRSSVNGQGGKRELSAEEIGAFWRTPKLRSIVDIVDVESGMDVSLPGHYSSVIRSHHDFDSIPSGALESLADRFHDPGSARRKRIAKIAGFASDITDAIPFWQLQKDYPGILPIAMGQFGSWFRILSISQGAPFTYASLSEKQSTAPGQISFDDLADVYRAESLTSSTEIYGIVALKASSSISPYIHNAAFRDGGRDAVYIPLSVKDCEGFYTRMAAPGTREIDWNLKGLSVTLPHKETFAGLVDKLDGEAAEIGAVNTVRIDDGRTIGFNTDARGFFLPLRKKLGTVKGLKAGIIGSGGAAKAAAYALSEANSEVVIFSRSPENAREMQDRFGADVRPLSSDVKAFEDLDIIINASPIGSLGELESLSPVPAECLENLQLAYDLVYNPISTRFLRDAENAGIPTLGGLDMLIEQALLQYEIWTGSSASRETMMHAAKSRIGSLT